MKIQELVEQGLIPTDHWLTKARVLDEDVSISDGRVTWENGTWKGGIWEDGIWKDGTWERGIWKDGTWKDGYKQIGFCKWPVLWSKDLVKIGCKDKTYKEWDLWFDSENTFETPRNTEEFRLIHNSYLAARAVRVIEYGDLTEKEDEKALF